MAPLATTPNVTDALERQIDCTLFHTNAENIHFPIEYFS